MKIRLILLILKTQEYLSCPIEPDSSDATIYIMVLTTEMISVHFSRLSVEFSLLFIYISAKELLSSHRSHSNLAQFLYIVLFKKT